MLDISGGELVTKEANSIGTGRICRGQICKGAKPLTIHKINLSLRIRRMLIIRRNLCLT